MAPTSPCAQTETTERGDRNLWPIDWVGAADLSLASSVGSSVAASRFVCRFDLCETLSQSRERDENHLLRLSLGYPTELKRLL